MGQPITIYKGNEESTVYGKAQLESMLADGWSLEKPEPKPAKKATVKK